MLGWLAQVACLVLLLTGCVIYHFPLGTFQTCVLPPAAILLVAWGASSMAARRARITQRWFDEGACLRCGHDPGHHRGRCPTCGKGA